MCTVCVCVCVLNGGSLLKTCIVLETWRNGEIKNLKLRILVLIFYIEFRNRDP